MANFYGKYPVDGGGGSSGITSINGDTNPAQILLTGTAGTNFAIVDDGAGNHTFNLPVASASNTGKLSSTDWSTFNSKQAALTIGNLTDAGTDGIVITGGTGAVIGAGTSIAQHVADTAHNGYLSSTDWNTFNGKQASGNYITALTGDVTASGPGSVAATLATVNSNVGSFGSSTAIPSFTVNGKGLITAASTNVVIAPAGTLTGTTLASNVVTSSLTAVGTIGTGVWQGTAVGALYGGTGGNSSASTGIAHISSGTWSYSSIVAADIASGTITNTQISSSAAIDRSKMAAFTIQNKTSTYAILTTDDLVTGDATGGGFTLTLPAATSVRRIPISRKDNVFANTLTIARAGSDTIKYQGSSLTSFSMFTQDELIELMPDGTSAWYVCSRKTDTTFTGAGFTFTGLGTVSGLNVTCKRSGRLLIVYGEVTAGTTTAVAMKINFPTGIAVDTNYITSNANQQGLGFLNRLAQTSQNLAGANAGPFTLFYDGSTTGALFCASHTGVTTNQFSKDTGDTILSANDSASFNFMIPVSGWND